MTPLLNSRAMPRLLTVAAVLAATLPLARSNRRAGLHLLPRPHPDRRWAGPGQARLRERDRHARRNRHRDRHDDDRAQDQRAEDAACRPRRLLRHARLSTTRTRISAMRAGSSSRSISRAANRCRICSTALNAPRSCARQANGCRAEGGTTLCGRRRLLPTRQELDAVTHGHPAIFERVDGHIAIANTAALEAAGITRTTPDPKGGKFDHDAQANSPGSCAKTPRWRWSSKLFRRRRRQNANAPSRWRLPMHRSTESPACRTTPSGTTSW